MVSASACSVVAIPTWAGDENVGELTLEQLHTQIRQISHVYLKAPTKPVFLRTRELRDRALALLTGQQRPSHTRELYAAAGWSLAGLDVGGPQPAGRRRRSHRSRLAVRRAGRP
jgi:hypothetical protein